MPPVTVVCEDCKKSFIESSYLINDYKNKGNKVRCPNGCSHRKATQFTEIKCLGCGILFLKESFLVKKDALGHYHSVDCSIKNRNRSEMLESNKRAANTRRINLQKTLFHRFWKRTEIVNIEDPDSCWEWIGGIDCDKGEGRSYGRMNLFRHSHERSHRFGWKLLYGDIPKGLLVLHWCDNPLCVRPDHLWLGTYKDNSDDKYLKGRGTIGEKSWCSKLSEDQVKEIKLAQKGDDPPTSRHFANKFGVKNTTILSIIKGKSWKHIKV